MIHWPIPDSPFAADEKVFEQIAMEAAGAAALRPLGPGSSGKPW